MQNEINFKITEGLEGNVDAIHIRKTVFMEEQDFKNEFDDIDSESIHIVIYCNDRPAATGRFYEENGTAHIGRIAVLKEFRGMGLGSVAVMLLESCALNKGFKVCCLSAQTRVQSFYEKIGYKPQGEIYLDEYCPHIFMYKELI